MVFGLHEYCPFNRFEASAVKAMRLILTREILFPINFALASSQWRRSFCRSRHTWRWESRILSSPRMSSRNHCPNSVLSKVLFFSVVVLGCIDIGSLLPLLLFEEAGFYPHREGNGFPMHAWKFYLRFNIVRILWAILVIFHGRLWRSDDLSKVYVRHSGIFNDGTCIGGWFWIHSHTWDCSREHSPVCTRAFEYGGCPSMQQSGLSLPFVFCVPSLWLLFILFPLSPLHLESTLLGVKDLLFVLLGFPRHASLRDRSPESSETYVTLDSRSSLIRTTFGVHTSVFPGSHLRVSRTPQISRVTWRILSPRDKIHRDETTCAWFHFQRELSEELP